MIKIAKGYIRWRCLCFIFPPHDAIVRALHYIEVIYRSRLQRTNDNKRRETENTTTYLIENVSCVQAEVILSSLQFRSANESIVRISPKTREIHLPITIEVCFSYAICELTCHKERNCNIHTIPGLSHAIAITSLNTCFGHFVEFRFIIVVSVRCFN